MEIFEDPPHSYQTLDVRQAKLQLLQHFNEHQIIPLNPPSFLFREDTLDLGKIKIYHFEFIGGVEFRNIINENNFIAHFLLSHQVEIRQNRTWKRLDAPTAFILSPDQSPDFRFPNGGRMLVLQTNNDVLDQKARQLIQPSPSCKLTFPIYGFDEHCILNLQKTLKLIVEQYEQSKDKAYHTIWLPQADQFVLTQLLLNLPNNFTDQFQYHQQGSLPATLIKACNWLQTVLDQPFSIRKLCQQSQCSQRTLQYQFNKYFGCSPRDYFMTEKLDALRRDLQTADHSDSVTEIALKWGFNHSGRLAQQYRRRFGEPPSKTLNS